MEVLSSSEVLVKQANAQGGAPHEQDVRFSFFSDYCYFR